MREFVGLRSKCYAFLCTGKVDKTTANVVKRKVKDDHLHFAHYLDVLRSFKSYVCKQNLISSTNHTAFDPKRRLCEDTVHRHSHGHKDTVSNPSDLFTTNVGLFSHNDLPGTTLLAEWV